MQDEVSAGASSVALMRFCLTPSQEKSFERCPLLMTDADE
jgi:hypothetical protein